jgi:DNA invertase Pin-like site-specific DNA recombinase
MSEQVRGGAGRALITARKSTKVEGVEGGTGLSLDSQGEAARAFCERQGWTVVDVTEDIVSGSVDPRSRKALSRWLNDPEYLSQYDVIVSYTMDRLSRGKAEHYSRLEAWPPTTASSWS